MEVTLKIDQVTRALHNDRERRDSRAQDNNGTWEHVLEALFVVAARDPRTKK